MCITRVVTVFLRNNDKFLILKRSDRVRTMQGLWAGISGIIEGNEEPLLRAKTEILEEVGISEDKITLAASAKSVKIRSTFSDGRTWEIFPFLFDVKYTHITLNWENSEYRWIYETKLGEYRTVPGLGTILTSLL